MIIMITASSLDSILSQLYPLHTVRPVFKFNLIIILPSIPWSSRFHFPFRYTDCNFVCIFRLPMRVACPVPFILLDSATLTMPGHIYIMNLFVMYFFSIRLLRSSFLLLLLFLVVGWDRVHFVRRSLTGLLYHLRMIDDECGAVGGMIIGRRNRSTRRKPAPVPLCSPQIPHDLTWARTRATAVGSRRLTAWAMARPCYFLSLRALSSEFHFITASVGTLTNFWVP
jgi:hypothetical protein